MTTLFWDKNIGRAIPIALQRLTPPEVRITYYLEQYPGSGNLPEYGDDAWLQAMGQKNWIVISQDYNLHVRQNELHAIKHYRVGCFYLWGASSSKWETFRCFMRGYDRIMDAIANSSPPFVYRVHKNGVLKTEELS